MVRGEGGGVIPGAVRHAIAAAAGILATLAPAVPAGAAAWSVLSRSEGCVPLAVLVRGDALPRQPVSPEDYAQMMRDRGHTITVGLPPGFPAELAGKVVMVQVAPDHAPVFVTEEVCRQLSAKDR